MQDSPAAWRGTQVQLLSCQGNVLKSTLTNAAGNFSFAMAAGQYELRFVAPAGMRLSARNQGNSPWLDSNPNPSTGLSGCLSVSDHQSRTWMDAGFKPL